MQQITKQTCITTFRKVISDLFNRKGHLESKVKMQHALIRPSAEDLQSIHRTHWWGQWGAMFDRTFKSLSLLLLLVQCTAHCCSNKPEVVWSAGGTWRWVGRGVEHGQVEVLGRWDGAALPRSWMCTECFRDRDCTWHKDRADAQCEAFEWNGEL